MQWQTGARRATGPTGWSSTTSRPADVFRLSTHTHTQWTFMSDTVDSDDFQPFPVLKLDYRLATDLSGDVKAGAGRTRSRCGPRRRRPVPPGQADRDEARRLLRRRRLVEAGRRCTGAPRGWWTGHLATPKKPGGFISVRAAATMNSGYSIKQQIIRAYGLR